MFTRRIALSRQISKKVEKGKAEEKEKNRDRDKKGATLLKQKIKRMDRSERRGIVCSALLKMC